MGKRLSDVEARRYVAESRDPTTVARGPRIGGSGDVARECSDIANETQEHFILFTLNVRHRLLRRRVLHVGTLTGVECSPRDVFRFAFADNAASIIVAHNHPSGDTQPSRQDIELTRRLREAGDLMGVPLLDHVIVAADGFVSMADLYGMALAPRGQA